MREEVEIQGRIRSVGRKRVGSLRYLANTSTTSPLALETRSCEREGVPLGARTTFQSLRIGHLTDAG